jgi:flagellar biosynthesis protein FliQ
MASSARLAISALPQKRTLAVVLGMTALCRQKLTYAPQQTKCMVQCFIAIPISVQLLIEFVTTLAGVGRRPSPAARFARYG